MRKLKYRRRIWRRKNRSTKGKSRLFKTSYAYAGIIKKETKGQDLSEIKK